MPNGIKYNLSAETLALKKGDFYIATGDVPKGPTSTSGYWYGITPPSGGYTIYLNKVSNGPSIYVPSNNSELIGLTNKIAGTSFTGATQCLNYYATQTDKMVFNRDYEGIVTSGLTLCLDAGFIPSYQGSGTTWYDLGYSGFNGTLTNGPTYSTDGGGTIVFDGSDDYIIVNSGSNILSNVNYTKTAWFYVTNFATANNIISSNGGGQHAFWLFSTNKLNAGHNGVWNTVVSTTTLSLNTWYFGAVTFSTTSGWKLYLNGVQEATSVDTTTFTGIGDLSVGSYWSGNFFTGRISIAQIYNRVLSASEILQNFNAQKSRYVASFDADAQAFITAAGITNSTQQTAINQLVLDLKSYNIWSYMVAIYPFVGGTATTNKYNLKNTSTYTLSFGGGWTHSSTGSLPNGTNGYADTGINPNTDLGSNHNYSVYSRTDNTSYGNTIGTYELGNGFCGENGFVAELQLYLRNGNVLLVRDQPNGNYGAISNTSTLGYFTINRTSTLTAYKNGSSIGSFSAALSLPYNTISLSAAHIYDSDCGTTYYDEYDNRELAFATFANSSLTSTNISNLNTAVQAFQTTLGRQV